MSIITTIELDIEGEIEKAWGVVEGVVVKDAGILWNDAKALLLTFAPAEYTALKALILKVKADVQSGDIGDIESAVLNAAEAAGLAFVAKVGSPLLQVFTALIKAL